MLFKGESPIKGSFFFFKKGWRNMKTIKTIKIGKHVKIVRYPWTFGLGITIEKFYQKQRVLRIVFGPLTIFIDFDYFYVPKKSKYQTIRKE